MVALLNRIRGRHQPSQAGPAPLLPLCNLYEVDAFAFRGDYVRADLFRGLPIHYHDDEEGAFLTLEGEPILHVDGAQGKAKAGDIFHFVTDVSHGIVDSQIRGKIVAFHAGWLLPEEGYHISVAERTPHPAGGDNVKLVYRVDGEPVDRELVWGPESGMTPMAARRDLQSTLRQSARPYNREGPMADLVADYNAQLDTYPFAREMPHARVNIFAVGELPVHEHDKEEGFFVVVEGSPEVSVAGQSCIAKPGDIFHFEVGVPHGLPGGGDGRILAFHGRTEGVYA